MMGSHEIKASKLAVGYDNKVIIPNLDVTIPDGKVSVIIGANGCG